MSLDSAPTSRLFDNGWKCRKCGQYVLPDQELGGDRVNGVYHVEHANPEDCVPAQGKNDAAT